MYWIYWVFDTNILFLWRNRGIFLRKICKFVWKISGTDLQAVKELQGPKTSFGNEQKRETIYIKISIKNVGMRGQQQGQKGISSLNLCKLLSWVSFLTWWQSSFFFISGLKKSRGSRVGRVLYALCDLKGKNKVYKWFLLFFLIFWWILKDKIMVFKFSCCQWLMNDFDRTHCGDIGRQTVSGWCSDSAFQQHRDDKKSSLGVCAWLELKRDMYRIYTTDKESNPNKNMNQAELNPAGLQ